MAIRRFRLKQDMNTAVVNHSEVEDIIILRVVLQSFRDTMLHVSGNTPIIHTTYFGPDGANPFPSDGIREVQGCLGHSPR